MSVREKLSAMEQLWDDLCARPGTIPSPEWHGKVLSEREERVRKGEARFSTLAEVKRRIRRARR